MTVIARGELTFIGDTAAERTDITPPNSGSLFFALDTKEYFVWDGSSWQILGGVAASRLINTTAPLTGGGDLSADRTLAISAATSASAGSMSAADKAIVDKLNALLPISKDPTGFTDPANVIVTYDPTARTIALTGTVAAYWQGTPISALTSGWTSGSHANSNGVYYLSYDGSSFVWSTTPWTFEKLQIAYVNYRGVGGDTFAIRECHGLMPWQAHEEFHETIGTYRESGGALGGYVPASTAAANRRPTVSACVMHDEDNVTTNAALAAGSYTQMYLTSTGVVTWVTAAAEIVPVLTLNPYYNLFSTPNWTQVLMANNSYMSVWLIAIPATASVQSQKYRFVWVQGQSNGNLASQTGLTPASLNLGNFSSLASEFVFIAQVILRYTGSNWDINSVINITGNKYLHTSSPAGYLTAVDVQTPLTGNGTVGTPISIIPGANTGDFIRFNAVSGVWEVAAEPIALKELLLTPAAAPLLDAEGAMYYNSTAKAVMVCANI